MKNKSLALTQALATLLAVDPSGSFLDALGDTMNSHSGRRIKKTMEEMNDSDRLALANAVAKRERRAKKKMQNE